MKYVFGQSRTRFVPMVSLEIKLFLLSGFLFKLREFAKMCQHDLVFVKIFKFDV
jgi:hypothetical protein